MKLKMPSNYPTLNSDEVKQEMDSPRSLGGTIGRDGPGLSSHGNDGIDNHRSPAGRSSPSPSQGRRPGASNGSAETFDSPIRARFCNYLHRGAYYANDPDYGVEEAEGPNGRARSNPFQSNGSDADDSPLAEPNNGRNEDSMEEESEEESNQNSDGGAADDDTDDDSGEEEPSSADSVGLQDSTWSSSLGSYDTADSFVTNTNDPFPDYLSDFTYDYDDDSSASTLSLQSNSQPARRSNRIREQTHYYDYDESADSVARESDDDFTIRTVESEMHRNVKGKRPATPRGYYDLSQTHITDFFHYTA